MKNARGVLSTLSFLALAAATSWPAKANAGTVWCYNYQDPVGLRCDNDSGGTFGHSGPDGQGLGVTLAPGNGSSITSGGANAVYRLYNFNTLVHLYTTDLTEAQNANNYYGFNFEQVEAVAVDCVNVLGGCPGPYAMALYRASNNVNHEFLYTTSLQEAQTTNGYTYNGIAFYVYKNIAGLCPLYRLYDWYTGVHYYTVSPHEWNASQSGPYVTQEGIMGYLSPLRGYSCPN